MSRLVYRAASGTDDSLTPRPGKDTEGPQRGLSTFLTAAAAPDGRLQVIDLDLLPPVLRGIEDSSGHLSIVPVKQDGSIDEDQLREWANWRKTNRRHAFTDAVLRAIVRVEEPND